MSEGHPSVAVGVCAGGDQTVGGAEESVGVPA